MHAAASNADNHELSHADGHEHNHVHNNEHNHVHNNEHNHGHHHAHTHDPKEEKAIINRLAKAIGHLESVKHMVEDGRDCSEVLVQLAAVRAALNNTGKEILKQHISHCIVEAVEEGDTGAIDELNLAIDKFMK